MPAIRLDQRRVDALKPRRATYGVRNRNLKRFGVRILPGDGKTNFMHSDRLWWIRTAG